MELPSWLKIENLIGKLNLSGWFRYEKKENSITNNYNIQNQTIILSLNVNGSPKIIDAKEVPVQEITTTKEIEFEFTDGEKSIIDKVNQIHKLNKSNYDFKESYELALQHIKNKSSSDWFVTAATHMANAIQSGDVNLGIEVFFNSFQAEQDPQKVDTFSKSKEKIKYCYERLQNIRHVDKSGELKEDNISIESSKFKYDLIIVIGTGDLENLGTIYDENSELFYEAPVVNIDHNPSNEYFGKINFVDVAVSSSSEIIFNLISSIDEKLFDENISTNLLAGIISETESFQNKNTTPKAFLAAASLVSYGANKQNITRFLYKTKSISLLKLMGKVMSNLKYNGQYKLGWSIIEEFPSDAAQLENLRTAIMELGGSSPEFNLLFVLFKQDNIVKGIINFLDKTPIETLAKSLNGEIENGQIFFVSKEQLMEGAEKDVLKSVKEWADSLKR